MRYGSSLDSGHRFATDANGREMQVCSYIYYIYYIYCKCSELRQPCASLASVRSQITRHGSSVHPGAHTQYCSVQCRVVKLRGFAVWCSTLAPHLTPRQHRPRRQQLMPVHCMS